MATGDQADCLARIKATMPGGWFPDSTPILDGLLSGCAAGWSWSYSMLAFVKAQSRRLTASGIFVDMIAADFFGSFIKRRVNETDAALSARIGKELFRQKGTRAGLIAALTDLTGRVPAVFEPAYAFDTGSYGTTAGATAANLIHNPTAAGAFPGAPIHWMLTGGTGLTLTVVDVVTDTGIPCIDISLSGTPSATDAVDVWFDLPPGPAILPTATYTFSCYASVQAGALSGTPFIQCNLSTSSGGAYGAFSGAGFTIPNTTLTRFSITKATASNIYFWEPLLRIPFTAGVPVSFTLRVGGPQLEVGAVASSFSTGAATYPALAGGTAYGMAGGYGNLSLPFQYFVTAYRPAGVGVATVAGYGNASTFDVGAGGYGIGAIEYANPSMFVAQVADADILNTINDVRPVATVAWTRISN